MSSRNFEIGSRSTWAEWDRQIEQDSANGKLDQFFAKARADHAAGKSTKL